MKPTHKMAFTFTFLVLLFATAGAIDAMAQLLIKADENSCKLSIDGEAVATIKANGVYKANVGTGEHLLEAVSLDGYRKVELTVKIENSEQKVIKLQLTPNYEKIAKDAYEGRLTVSMIETKPLYKECSSSGSNYGDIPAGTRINIASSQIFSCGGSRNSFKVAYNGFVGYIFIHQVEFK